MGAAKQPWTNLFRLAAALAAVLTFGLAAAQPSSPATPQVVPASRQANHVAVIPVHGALDPFMTSSIERRLARAKALGADAVVLEFDCESSQRLVTASEAIAVLKASPIPFTVAWLRTRAVGGAGLLALSCRDIITTETGALGGLIENAWLDGPFSFRGRGRTNVNAAALQNAAIALAAAIEAARRTGRDEFLVQALAIPGVELWLVQNTAGGERRCVTEPEYRLMFGKAPSRAAAELTPGPPLPILRSVTSALQAQGAGKTHLAPPTSTSAGLSAPWPASATADAILSSQGSVGEVTLPTARPVVSPADLNRWTLVTYAVEPGAPALLHGDQLVKYGLAQQVVKTDAELAAYFGAQKVTRLEQSWAEHAARFLAHPVVRGVLITLFLIAMFIELSHPGMVIPGLIAAAALILILAPAFIVGVSGWWSLGAIALGVVLLSLEIFVIPGFGVAGVVGLVVLFVGLVFTFLPDGPAGLAFSSPDAQTALLRGVVTVLLSSITAFFGLFFVIRQLGTLPLLQRYTLQSPGPGEVDESIFGPIRPNENASVAVGDQGVATTPLRPAGKAMFGPDYFDVVAEAGYIAEGTPVRVVEADRFRIVVDVDKSRPAPAPPADA